MSSHDVRFGGSGIPQTVLPAEAETVERAVQDARAAQGDTRREALAEAASKARVPCWCGPNSGTPGGTRSSRMRTIASAITVDSMRFVRTGGGGAGT